MKGLGTIVNALAVIFGGIIGLFAKRLINDRMQETVIKATGFSTIFLGASGTFARMLTSEDGGITLNATGSMTIILSLVLGALVGELIDIDARFEQFGGWLRHKTGSDGDSQFINGFVTASLTVCIGAMAIMGSIQDGIYGDHATLFAKAVLDFVIILIMASSMGKGCIFAFIPVAVLQGGVTLLAAALSGLMTPSVLDGLSMVGNILICCVGVNLVWPGTVRVANLLPSIVFACALNGLSIGG